MLPAPSSQVTGQGDAMDDSVIYHVRTLQCHAPGTLARVFAQYQLHVEFYPVIIANVKRRLRHSPRLAIDADDIANLTLYRTKKRSSESSTQEIWNRVAFLKFCIDVSNRLVSVEKRHCSRQKRSADLLGQGQGYTTQEMATRLDCDRRTIERNLNCIQKRIQETLTKNKPR